MTWSTAVSAIVLDRPSVTKYLRVSDFPTIFLSFFLFFMICSFAKWNCYWRYRDIWPLRLFIIFFISSAPHYNTQRDYQRYFILLLIDERKKQELFSVWVGSVAIFRPFLAMVRVLFYSFLIARRTERLIPAMLLARHWREPTTVGENSASRIYKKLLP